MKKIKCEECGATIAMIDDEGRLHIMCNHRAGKRKCKNVNVISTGLKVNKE
ncbi:MAG: hypothetical protein ACI4EY_12440 [Lachnospiraceae bacterium]